MLFLALLVLVPEYHPLFLALYTMVALPAGPIRASVRILPSGTQVMLRFPSSTVLEYSVPEIPWESQFHRSLLVVLQSSRMILHGAVETVGHPLFLMDGWCPLDHHQLTRHFELHLLVEMVLAFLVGLAGSTCRRPHLPVALDRKSVV